MKQGFLLLSMFVALTGCNSGDSSDSPARTYSIELETEGVRAPVSLSVNGGQSQTLQPGEVVEVTMDNPVDDWQWTLESQVNLQACVPVLDEVETAQLIRIHCEDKAWFLGGGNHLTDDGETNWYVTDGTVEGTTQAGPRALWPVWGDAYYNNQRVFKFTKAEEQAQPRYWLSDGTVEGTQPAPWSNDTIQHVTSRETDLFLLQTEENGSAAIYKLSGDSQIPMLVRQLPDLGAERFYSSIRVTNNYLLVFTSLVDSDAVPYHERVQQLSIDLALGTIDGPVPAYTSSVVVDGDNGEWQVSWHNPEEDEEGAIEEGRVLLHRGAVSEGRYLSFPIEHTSGQEESFGVLGEVAGKLVVEVRIVPDDGGTSCRSVFVIDGSSWQLVKDFCAGDERIVWQNLNLRQGGLYGIGQKVNPDDSLSPPEAFVFSDILNSQQLTSLPSSELEGQLKYIAKVGQQFFLYTTADVSDGDRMAPWIYFYKARLYSLDELDASPQLLAEGETVESLFGSAVAIAEKAAVNGHFLFALATVEAGLEPWVSDGTPEGTGLLKDLVPGVGFGIDAMEASLINFNAH